MTIRAMKRNGMIRVPTQNAFVRIRSMYSRRTTARTFFQFMRLSLDRPRFDARSLDGGEVDLLELRLAVGEGGDLAALQGPPQKIAPVRPGLERHDECAIDGRDRPNPRQRGKVRGGSRDRHPNLAGGVGALQLLQVPLQDLLRPRQQADLVAQFLGLLQYVRREHDRLAALAEVEQVLPD